MSLFKVRKITYEEGFWEFAYSVVDLNINTGFDAMTNFLFNSMNITSASRIVDNPTNDVLRYYYVTRNKKQSTSKTFKTF